MRTASYTELRSNLKKYMDTVVHNRDALIVHRPKSTSVVVISLDEYNAIKETEYLMSSPEMVNRIKEGEEEIRTGKGKAIAVEDLWK